MVIEDGYDFGEQLRCCRTCYFRADHKSGRVAGSRCRKFKKILKRDGSCAKHRFKIRMRINRVAGDVAVRRKK